MAKQFNLKKLFIQMSAAGVMGFSGCAMAAAFQLWEQDAASIGNYHAGTAASAEDASTAWYNPAGLVRIKNQQVILGADAVLTNFKFNGTVAVNTLVTSSQPVTAQGGGFNNVPFGHYAAPISDRFVFGLSVDAPFGLKTDYGNSTYARYAATKTALQVVDISPSLGIALTDKLSVGLGLDVQRLNAEFNLYGTAFFPTNDTVASINGSDTGYGYHMGGLYQFTPETRLGANFRSQVRHHVRGNSNFNGPLANHATGGNQHTGDTATNITLPSMATVSLFHSFNNYWDAMGSVSYVGWSVFRDIVLQNVAGVQGGTSSNTIVVTIPEHYRNSWNYSIGANYHPNEKWILRTGLGYDQSPSNDQYRNLQLPDSDRVALALGGHYQATTTIGFDLGWTHVFGMGTRISNLSQAVGDQISTTNGSVRSGADVYGFQVKWDIV